MSSKPRVIIVACGMGVASSHLSANRIKDRLAEYGIKNVTIRVVQYAKAQAETKYADVFVNLSPTDGHTYGCPVMNGLPFMTGFGMEAAMVELKAILDGGEKEA